jgi:gluconolactonase
VRRRLHEGYPVDTDMPARNETRDPAPTTMQPRVVPLLCMLALMTSTACKKTEADGHDDGAGTTSGVETGGPTDGGPTPSTVSNTGDATTTTATSSAAESEGSSGVDTGGSDTGDDVDPNQDPLEDMGQVVQVATDFQFTEGPVWRANPGILLFSDIPADTIYRLDPPGAISVFRGPTQPATNANGLNLDPDGRLLACEHSTARVTRFVDGTRTEVVADSFGTETFNSPNDVISRSDGTIYFTDPTYGGTGTVGFRGVYRVTPAGAVELVAQYANTQPNGIGLSPDESTLYVVDTTAGVIRSFPVAPDGSTGDETILAETGGGGDGMAVDVNGNLYVTANAGVLVLRPDGTSWGTLEFPEEPANCVFGGADRRTLYVTARTTLFSVDLAVPGLPPPG